MAEKFWSGFQTGIPNVLVELMCAEKIGSSLAPTNSILLNEIKKIVTSASVRFKLWIGTQGDHPLPGVANVVLEP